MAGEGETKATADTGGGGKEGAETTEIGGQVAIVFLIKLILEKGAGKPGGRNHPRPPKKTMEIGGQKKPPPPPPPPQKKKTQGLTNSSQEPRISESAAPACLSLPLVLH